MLFLLLFWMALLLLVAIGTFISTQLHRLYRKGYV